MGLVKKDQYGGTVPTSTAWALIAGVVTAILFFVLCFRTVDAGQVGIVTRFGEVNRVQTSGIAIKLPWPIEKMSKMETRVQKEEQDTAAATSDLQDVNAKLALNYALDNDTALKVYKTLGTDYKNRVVTPALQESFKAASARYTASELVTKRTDVKSYVLGVVKSRLEKYGIRVVDVNIVNFQFSAAFNQAVEEKQVAQQKAEKALIDLKFVKTEAEQKVERAKGDAEAQRLQQETLTPELLQRQAIDKWDGKMPQYVGANGVFGIPLTK